MFHRYKLTVDGDEAVFVSNKHPIPSPHTGKHAHVLSSVPLIQIKFIRKWFELLSCSVSAAGIHGSHPDPLTHDKT